MELNLKKNLFRFGKNEPLTTGVVLALILFDVLVWNLMSMGMISVDYKLAWENDCVLQVSGILKRDVPEIEYYNPKTGKYCALLQEESQKALSNGAVSNSLAQIRMTNDQIGKLRSEIQKKRRTLSDNARAYGVAIQEQKGLDLAYTEQLQEIQGQEKLLVQAEQTLVNQKEAFKKLPAVQNLVRYARENQERIRKRLDFMRKLDLFLTYVFAMLFVIILVPIFLLLRKRFVFKEQQIRVLLTNHVILVAVLQAAFITLRFILHILPETLLFAVVEFFKSMHLMALWYYIAIVLVFGMFAVVVYLMQTRGRQRNLYKKVVRGKCWNCGANVLNNECCFSCGAKQLCTCPHCKKKTYIKMPYCRVCGKMLNKDEAAR